MNIKTLIKKVKLYFSSKSSMLLVSTEDVIIIIKPR